jgi:hypothetical protein
MEMLPFFGSISMSPEGHYEPARRPKIITPARTIMVGRSARGRTTR